MLPVVGQRRFNEAAALLPRKMPGAGGAPGRDRTGFNEAAALLPRKMTSMISDTWTQFQRLQ